ncbi:MAG: relaxase domain-containing protein [Bryobacterales bacterium]|nr:relaxase domain-containing protein [Bryobacterales bacterium]
MLTIRAMSGGTGYAARHLEKNDYYAENERVVGHWFGKGAERLGLEGEVTQEQFEALRQGLDPNTGESLRPRQSADRTGPDGEVQSQGRAFYDNTLSAPKSVSVMAIPGGDERLIEAHRKAVAETLAELEAIAATRVRVNGENCDRTTGNVVMACYEHDASRALDPQLHTHCVAFNLTHDDVEERWKALQARPFYEQSGLLTNIYRNALAREVMALGYEIEQRTDAKGRDLGFEIKGLSPELLEIYSQRSAQRDAAIADFVERNHREPTENEIAVLVRETRPDKLAEISTAEVRALQLDRLTPELRREMEAVRDAARERTGYALEPSGSVHALDYALDHIFERVSVACEHEILETALEQGRGTVSMAELRASLNAMEKSGEVLRSGPELATRASLERECEMIDIVNAGVGEYERLGANRTHAPSKTLSDEQNEAVAFVLDSRDFAVNVQGAAGTGKTAMLREVTRELAFAGHATTAVAPTQSAVEELHKAGLEGAMTIERLLQDKEAQGLLNGRVLLVDEAGMVSGRQMHALLQLAEHRNARVLFSGDTQQIQPVEACDALRVLEMESSLKSVSLNQVRRQKDAAYRDAIESLRDDPSLGLEKLMAMDAVHLRQPLDRPKAVAEAYLAAKGEALVVCPTHAEIDAVTFHVREQRRAAGELGDGQTVERLEPLQWTNAQKSKPENFKPGHVLVFHRDTRDARKHHAYTVVDVQDGAITTEGDDGTTAVFCSKHAKAFSVFERHEVEVAPGDKLLLQENRRGDLHATNGERVTVQAIDADGLIHLDDGRVLPRDYRQFDYGYAVTAHRSQGKTVDHVIVSGEVMSKELFYVAASRGQKSIAVYTSDAELFEQSIARSAARQSATELAARQAAQQVALQQQQAHQEFAAPAPSHEYGAPSAQAQQSQNQSPGVSYDR